MAKQNRKSWTQTIKRFFGMKAEEAVENVLHMFLRTKSNREFIQMVKKRKVF